MTKAVAWDQDVDSCPPDCPVSRAHDVLAGKWTMLIFRDLLAGKRRFTALMRRLDGISPRVLTERLRMLEAAGLVLRIQYATNPPTTEYQLTDLGRGVAPLVAAMADFGLALQRAGR